jgi:hypothetical protein
MLAGYTTIYGSWAIGPSLGNLYVHEWERGFGFMVLRLSLSAVTLGIIYGEARQLERCKDESSCGPGTGAASGAAVIITAPLMVLSGFHDIVTAHRRVRKANIDYRKRNLSWQAALFRCGDGALGGGGLAVVGSF